MRKPNNTSWILFICILSILTNCKTKNSTQDKLIEEQQEYKGLCATATVSSDTVIYKDKVIVKAFLTNKSYKNKYKLYKGIYIIYKENLNVDLKTDESSIISKDAFDVVGDTTVFNIKTEVLPFSNLNGKGSIYFFDFYLILKNKTTGKDSSFGYRDKFYVMKN